MKLRIIGCDPQNNKSQKTVVFENESRGSQSYSNDEEVPLYTKHDDLKTFTAVKTEKLVKFKASFLINEDPRRSSFAYSKLMAIEKLSAILCLLIFFLSCTKTQLDVYYKTSNSPAALYFMRCISISVIALLIVLVLRHIALFELEVSQNRVYVNKNRREGIFTEFFKHNDKVRNLVLEMLLAAPHPVSFLSQVRVQLYQSYDEVYFTHSLNDLLSLLLVAKFYIIFRSLLNITSYSSPRSSRLCYQNGFENSHLYSIKCILNDMPIKIIAMNFGLFIIIGGYCLKLTEGVLFLYNPGYHNDFETYTNCFWCIFITMATVGYGDTFPKTLPGRFIIIFIAISGVLLSSLLIVSLNLYLNMAPSETKSHVIITRLMEHDQLVKQAKAAIAHTIKVKQLMESREREDCELEFQFENLKKTLENAQNRSRVIKSLVDNDNIIQEMSRLFFILRDNLKDLYMGQIQLKDKVAKIEQIEQIAKVKESFIKEVTQLLSKTENTPADSAHLSEKKSTPSRSNLSRSNLSRSNPSRSNLSGARHDELSVYQ